MEHVDVLACPHCGRSFHPSPAVLGRKIRCRECRGIFHVPHDTTNVPLQPVQDSKDSETLPPLATPCLIDGHDARSCPECGRTFRMKPAFAGKTIRCRGCKVTFRVRATESTLAEEARPPTPAAPAETLREPPPLRPLRPPPPPKPPGPAAARPATIFEDIGDVLEELLPGEEVPSVVRPRRFVPRAMPVDSPVATLVAVAFGGICAIPIALLILRVIAPAAFRRVVEALPDFLKTWLQ